jgi:hypothetical protein
VARKALLRSNFAQRREADRSIRIEPPLRIAQKGKENRHVVLNSYCGPERSGESGFCIGSAEQEFAVLLLSERAQYRLERNFRQKRRRVRSSPYFALITSLAMVASCMFDVPS